MCKTYWFLSAFQMRGSCPDRLSCDRGWSSGGLGALGLEAMSKAALLSVSPLLSPGSPPAPDRPLYTVLDGYIPPYLEAYYARFLRIMR